MIIRIFVLLAIGYWLLAAPLVVQAIPEYDPATLPDNIEPDGILYSEDLFKTREGDAGPHLQTLTGPGYDDYMRQLQGAVVTCVDTPNAKPKLINADLFPLSDVFTGEVDPSVSSQHNSSLIMNAEQLANTVGNSAIKMGLSLYGGAGYNPYAAKLGKYGNADPVENALVAGTKYSMYEIGDLLNDVCYRCHNFKESHLKSQLRHPENNRLLASDGTTMEDVCDVITNDQSWTMSTGKTFKSRRLCQIGIPFIPLSGIYSHRTQLVSSNYPTMVDAMTKGQAPITLDKVLAAGSGNPTGEPAYTVYYQYYKAQPITGPDILEFFANSLVHVLYPPRIWVDKKIVNGSAGTAEEMMRLAQTQLTKDELQELVQFVSNAKDEPPICKPIDSDIIPKWVVELSLAMGWIKDVDVCVINKITQENQTCDNANVSSSDFAGSYNSAKSLFGTIQLPSIKVDLTTPTESAGTQIPTISAWEVGPESTWQINAACATHPYGFCRAFYTKDQLAIVPGADDGTVEAAKIRQSTNVSYSGGAGITPPADCVTDDQGNVTCRYGSIDYTGRNIGSEWYGGNWLMFMRDVFFKLTHTDDDPERLTGTNCYWTDQVKHHLPLDLPGKMRNQVINDPGCKLKEAATNNKGKNKTVANPLNPQACMGSTAYSSAPNPMQTPQFSQLPGPIQTAISAAAQKYAPEDPEVLKQILTGIAYVEGSAMWSLSTAQAADFTRPWNADELTTMEAKVDTAGLHCSANFASARGPFQVTPDVWQDGLGASGNPNQDICNITDAVFASAKHLTVDRLPIYGYPPGSSWTNNRKICALVETWYGTCLQDSASCRLGTDYCDFILDYIGRQQFHQETCRDLLGHYNNQSL